jgi:hypothetical protein
LAISVISRMRGSGLIFIPGVLFLFFTACKKERSNGETIFRTGKNINGEIVVFRKSGENKIATACEDCHGRGGGNILNKDESIKYKDLSNPKLRKISYNDSLIKRFLEEKLKSDGSPANSPAFTKMNEQDKNDLIQFLKAL